MTRSGLIGLAALLSASAAAMPAPALPMVSAPTPIAAAKRLPLVAVRYHRHFRRERAATSEAANGDGVKPGRWQFASQLEAPPIVPSTGSAGGGLQTTYSSCITAENAVPVAVGPQCKFDSNERSGSTVTWSMTCTNPQNAVRSEGSAQYHGDSMAATMVSHLPGANGAALDMRQQITGRYLGPCTPATAGPIIPPANQSASGAPIEPPAATAAQQTPPAPAGQAQLPATAQQATPPAATGPAPPPATAQQTATAAAQTPANAGSTGAQSTAAAEPEAREHERRHRHYARHWRRHHYRRRWAGYAYGGFAPPWPLSMLFGR